MLKKIKVNRDFKIEGQNRIVDFENRDTPKRNTLTFWEKAYSLSCREFSCRPHVCAVNMKPQPVSLA